jgi:hypothetical protein
MMDAILYAYRDAIRLAGFGYADAGLCEIMSDGHPPPRCGNIFVAVHPGMSTNNAMRNLDEYFGFSFTLTERVSVPLDRVGDQMLASKLARKRGKNNPSFTSRIEQLRSWGHMNWDTGLYNANVNLSNWRPDETSPVYGFVEVAHFVSAEQPQLVGPDWFSATPQSGSVGLKAEIRFDGARRMQPQTLPVGPFV